MKLSVIVASALVAALAVMCFARPGSDISTLKGKPFPAFKMVDSKGKAVTNKSLKGKVVLIDFWATWCGPCKMGMPTMQRLYAKFRKQGLVVIGADVLENGKDAATKGFAYAKSQKLSYLFTTQGDSVAQKLGIQGIPALFLLDKNGVIRDAKTGFDPSGGEERELSGKITQLLKR
jgi:thiol-disulfide isomerase/thioredoxin